MLPIVLVLSLLAPASRNAIQNASCSALTASEIEAAVGSKPAQSEPTDMDDGKGQRMLGCIWTIQSQKIQVTFGTGRLPAGAASDHLRLLTSNRADGLAAGAGIHRREEGISEYELLLRGPAIDAQRRDVHVHMLCDREVVARFDRPHEPEQEALDRSAKTLLDKAAARQR